MGRFAGQTLAGQAYLAMNRLEDARSSLRLAEREMEQLPAAVTKSLPDAGLLNGEIMLYEKNWEKGNALIRKVEEEMVAVPGPDAWSESLFQLESVASTARRVGDWELAESTAKDDRAWPKLCGRIFRIRCSGRAPGRRRQGAKGIRRSGKALEPGGPPGPTVPNALNRDFGRRARLAS
jgi:hypothetical protein